jgi:ABC-2 type transport system permease protein
VIGLGAGLAGLAIVFSRTTELAGWSRPQLLAVMGVFTIVGGIVNAFIAPSMQLLLDDIARGTLDHALTKPADAQTLVSVRQVAIWRTIDIAVGAIVVVVALVQLGGNDDAVHVLGRLGAFGLLLVTGTWTIYCFWIALVSTAFWLTRVDDLQELFFGLFRSGQYPVRVYPTWMRFGLTFLVPMAFAVTVPAEALTGRLTWSTVGVAAAATLSAGVLSRLVWRAGLRRYSGASA